ncbi:hypothetical protein OBBRIDRAFT_710617, partial [Obba rivulosa]
KGLLILFTVWCVEENLPFTMGESLGLVRLFRYLKTNKMLPTDTTVYNILAEIVILMHNQLVKDLAISLYAITPQMVFSFMASLTHYINNKWELVERLVDFWHLLDDEHQEV